MALVAAVGLAIPPMRDIYVRAEFQLFPFDPADLRSFSFYDSWTEALSAILRPLVITSSAALWLARLRRPRPSIRRVFRQPGMAATTAVLASFVIGTIPDSANMLFYWLLEGDEASRGDVCLMLLTAVQRLHVGKAVLAVWIVQRLGHARHAERSWIDRAGRSLGWYCLVETAAYGTSVF